MTVKPELIDPHHPPPRPIRVILDNTGARDVDVELTLKIGGQDRAFSVGDKRNPLTPKASVHKVPAPELIDAVCYLHEWGPAASLDTIEVKAKDPEGHEETGTSTII